MNVYGSLRVGKPALTHHSEDEDALLPPNQPKTARYFNFTSDRLRDFNYRFSAAIKIFLSINLSNLYPDLIPLKS